MHRFEWTCHPEAAAFVAREVAAGLAGNAFAADLARRMAVETSTRLVDWVDHLRIPERGRLRAELSALGFTPRADATGVFDHDGGMFPALVLSRVEGPALAIKVESVADFVAAHGLSAEILGPPLGPFRSARVEGVGSTFAAVERRGYRGFEPFPSTLARAGRLTPQSARDTLKARELWQVRPRNLREDDRAFDAAEAALSRMIELVGPDVACHLAFEVERDYWQARNSAARVQKARQDRLGLGWANHDHHTFRSSRRMFPRLMQLLQRMGFQRREHFHAGAQAGWGAQILEQPTTGIVVFADLDLAPDEADRDFAVEALPELPVPNTVGLWVGLHGESILSAGMHHLEAQFDFEALRSDLDGLGVSTMKPFSDYPFLRQAFTTGERWPVEPWRLDKLLGEGRIDADQLARFLADGAIGSHLENLQRADGYKGFNQRAVGVILAATDPRLNPLLASPG